MTPDVFNSSNFIDEIDESKSDRSLPTKELHMSDVIDTLDVCKMSELPKIFNTVNIRKSYCSSEPSISDSL